MKGTKSCLAHLERIANAVKKTVPEKVSEFVDDRASNAFNEYTSFAISNYVGPFDVSVVSTHEGNNWYITASGETLLFLEFGTGIRYQRSGEMLEMAAEYPAKSWSGSEMGRGYLTNPKKFAKWNGSWPTPPAGLVTDGNPPANVMYETRKMVRDFLPERVELELTKAVKS